MPNLINDPQSIQPGSSFNLTLQVRNGSPTKGFSIDNSPLILKIQPVERSGTDWESKGPTLEPLCPSSLCDSGRGLSTLGKAGKSEYTSVFPKPQRLQQQGASYLVAAGNNDVLWLGHDTALLGHQCVLGVAGEPVGGEEPIVLLHTELLT